MNAIEKLLPQLKSLRLSGILDTMEARSQQAIEQELSHLDFLGPVTIQSLEPIIRTFLCCGGGFESGILDVF